MTPNEFFEQLSIISPGIAPVPPLSIKYGQADIMAARLLLWLSNEMPDNTTIGDLQDVIDAAKWWSTFFASANLAVRKGENHE